MPEFPSLSLISFPLIHRPRSHHLLAVQPPLALAPALLCILPPLSQHCPVLRQLQNNRGLSRAARTQEGRQAQAAACRKAMLPPHPSEALMKLGSSAMGY